jgi:5-methylcytosine-specific restriction enzyme subunit McrC
VPRIACQFEHHTPELQDNHILAYTLAKIRRFEFKRDEIASAVANAARMLAMTVDVREVDANSCVGRFYDRMNSDYQPMHALCRFFLEHCGPADAAGSHEMLPFSLYMPGLFEAFVARWLESNLDEAYRIESQFHAEIDNSDGLFFRIDLVLRDATTDTALAVLDTKYKAGSGPSQSDIQQVVAYATRMRTTTAALIYPTAIAPSQFAVGDVTIHLLAFDISAELGNSGALLLTRLVSAVSRAEDGQG